MDYPSFSPFPCPDDGQRYACSDGCPYTDLESANFNATSSGENKCRPGRTWVGCEYITSLYVGCCKSHPCSDGSPPENLTQSKLAVNSSGAGYLPSTTEFWIPSPTSRSPPSVPTFTTEANTFTSISVPESPPAATTAPQPGQTTKPVPTRNTAAIAGGVIGGVVGLALLVAVLALCCRRRTIRPQQRMDEGRSPTWSSGQIRELDEMKQGQSPCKSQGLSIQLYIELNASLQHLRLRLCLRLRPHPCFKLHLYYHHLPTQPTDYTVIS